MRKTAGLILGILMGFPAPVLGEVRKGNFEVGGFIGREFFDTASRADDDFVVGFRVGYGLWKRLEVEVVFDNVDTNAKTFSEEGAQFESVTGNILWNFWSSPQGIAESYGTAGAGTMDVTLEIPGVGRFVDSDSSLITLGAGMRVFLKDRVALRYELRAKDYEVFDVPTTDLELSFGFSMVFGKRD